MKFEAAPGEHISAVCKKASEIASEMMEPVEFEFNGTKVIAQPGETSESLVSRWATDFEDAAKAHRESPEYKKAPDAREKERIEKEAAVLVESAAGEKEMREAKDPWPLTEKQLTEYIQSLVDRSHDYGTCVYAMSLAATAAFNYVAHRLGASGFQASCADLDFLRRSRHIKGPFIILKGEDALYPQYNLPEKLQEALDKWRPWLSEEAAERLKNTEHCSDGVIEHWRRLVDDHAGA